jgi:hypothetical protein
MSDRDLRVPWEATIITRDPSGIPAELAFPYRVRVVPASDWDDPNPPTLPTIAFAPDQGFEIAEMRATRRPPGQRVELRLRGSEDLVHDTVIEAVTLARSFDYDLTIKVWD